MKRIFILLLVSIELIIKIVGICFIVFTISILLTKDFKFEVKDIKRQEVINEIN